MFISTKQKINFFPFISFSTSFRQSVFRLLLQALLPLTWEENAVLPGAAPQTP